MSIRRSHLNLDVESFLTTHWQRKPLLVRSAIDDFQPPVSAEELAGLALEDSVESRLIDTRVNHAREAETHWQDPMRWGFHHGPFEAEDFQRTNPWTLLVQAVDHYLPDVAALRQYFHFLPTWRLDDVMVSYASDGGSVGPHYDNYDVFLLQGEGSRRWQLGQHCDDQSAMIDHPELRILDTFTANEDVVLHTGDMLYVPPGVAHWGIAEGPCTTFSIGFRAPQVNHMLARFIDSALMDIPDEQFYTDGSLTNKAAPGEIRLEDRGRAREVLRCALAQLEEREGADRWFGELLTDVEMTAPLGPQSARAVLRRWQDQELDIAVAAEARLAWQSEEHAIRVFANGVSQQFSPSLAPVLETLCSGARLESEILTKPANQDTVEPLLTWLLEQGAMDVEDDE